MDLQQIEDIYALSPLQQGLLFHSLYEPESSVYVEQISWALDGPLNVSAFTRAWQVVLDRHSILRTAFLWKETDKPVQMVFRHAQLPMRVVDWRALPEERQVAQFADYLAADRARGFDHDQAPLMRLSIIQRAKNSHYFIWSHHHLLLDGWSVALLLREVFMFYQTFCQGETLQLAASRPFRDYIAWQQRQDMTQAEAYWRKMLAGFTVPTRIDIGCARKSLQDSAQPYDVQHCLLAKPINDRLQAMVRQEKLTLNTLVQGAWSIMLSRYSGRQDILYGYAVSGRPADLPGVESMIGLFINTLPARVHVPADMPLLAWLHQLQEQQTEANQYHYTPLSQIQNWSDIATDQVLFESILGFENYPLMGLSGDQHHDETSLDKQQLRAQPMASFSMTHYPLSIIVVPGTEMEIRMLYDPRRFDKAVITRMLAHYQTVLVGMCDNRQQSLADVPMLSAQERMTLLHDWNDTALNYAKGLCIQRRVEHQAAQHPESVAVICGRQRLTYRALNERSNQLAHYLQSLGIGPDKLVGILMTRSIDMIIAQLSVLKAGGAYVPFDPAYPQPRITYMLQDSQAAVLLTEQTWMDNLPEYQGRRICLDRESTCFQQQPLTNPANTVSATDLAYVIYTSGSTGKPKGVEIEHGGLANLVNWHLHTYQIDGSDHATQLAGAAFDASVWEIWPYLAAGASLYIVDDETRSSPAKLLAYYAEYGITYSFVPTPLAEAMLAVVWPPNLALKALLTGGDTLHQPPANDLPCALINHYGPTESTVVATRGIIDRGSLHTPPDIGRPIANTQVYILDSLLRPVPIGVAGELCIGGDSLARGYHHRPELTQEKFIINPCKAEAKQRIYKTGDLARFLEDGRIEFLGRIDSQVKIRGYRIELGEIETLLDQHTGIQQAAVALQQEAAEDRRLTAYVVSSPGYDWSDPLVSSQAIDGKQISHWLTLYDGIYSENSAMDTDFNIVGWNSSATGLPIPEPEMRDWVAQTVSRLNGFKLDRVLEIGCGTGLLLWRLVSQCDEYVATDFSEKALEQVSRQLSHHGLPQVSLLQCTADDFQGITNKTFDTVILNSVTQYFPSIDYLRRVLQQAVAVTAAGGVIFIGDIRNLQLLEAFHASVELSNANGAMSVSNLKKRISSRLSQERELVIDPAFFYALKDHFPQISQVFVQLKRGHYRNEMTCYRYDVMLVIGSPSDQQAVYSQLDWSADALSMDVVQQALQDQSSDRLLIKQVPNARIQQQIRLLARLETVASDATVAELQKSVEVTDVDDVDPEDFWDLAESLSYRCSIAWSDLSRGDCYDVLLEFNHEHKPLSAIPDFSFPTGYKLKSCWQDYANQPLHAMTSHDMTQQLRSFLQRQLPEYMVPTKFVLLDALPLNANGKIDRHGLPAASATRSDLEQAFVAPRSPVEQALAEIWVEVLGIEQVGIRDNFFELGGDSILSIQIVAHANDAGVQITPKQVFEQQTIAELAMVAGISEKVQADQQQLTGEVLLTPIQYWFFEQYFPDPYHFNQTLLLKVPAEIDEILVEQAVYHLLVQHDALRLHFSATADGWNQHYSQMTDAIPFAVEDVAGIAEAEQRELMESKAAQWQASLDLSEGPLVQVVMFKRGVQSARLLFIVHHLLVDGVSWRILLEDFTTAYRQLSDQQRVVLPEKTTSFQYWSKKSTEYAQSITLSQALPFFEALSQYTASPLPVDYHNDDRSLAHAKTVTLCLDKSQSQILLMQLPKIYHVQINDSLLTALLQTLARWTGLRQQLIDLEGHGREPLFGDVDLSRTVGWFTTICPVLLDLGQSVRLDEALLNIKEQLHGIPLHGLGYGLLRYLHDDPALKQQLANLPKPQISFNYMGQFRPTSASVAEYGPAPESSGPARSLRQNMNHLLEVNAQMVDGCLEVEWAYLDNCFKAATVQAIAKDYMASLRLLIETCQSADKVSYTPSDFPDVQLSQSELDKVMAEVNLASTEDD